MAQTKKTESAQKFVPIKEVSGEALILDDGSLRSIIMVSSINFALKSEGERNAVLMQFQNFLNTLDFSMQIFIRSREMDINPYLELLREQYEHQENELLKIQTREYMEFIKNFTQNVNIMTKTFFVVVPYNSFFKGKSGGFLSFLGKKESTEDEAASLEEQKIQLSHRVSVVEQGLSRTGLRTVRLKNDELIELFFSLFNPGEERSAFKKNKIK